MAYTIIKNYVPKLKYAKKCPYSMKPIGITIHNTYNDASAINEVKYMIGNNLTVSYHVAIDDKNVVLAIPFNRSAWHAGDGGKGTGNRKTISIEICYSKSGGSKFDKAEKNAAHYVATLLKEYDWTTKNIYPHRTWSGKYCPHRTLDKGWDRFIKMVQAELDILNGKKPETKPETDVKTETKKEPAKTTSAKKETNKIDTVKEVQKWVNKEYTFADIAVDGIYGKNTKKSLVKALQTELNQNYKKSLVIDGIWGKKTKAAVKSIKKGANNDIVKVLQAFLVCNGYKDAYLDGDFGNGTFNSLKAYQKKKKITVNGIADKNTFEKLCS